MEIIAIILAGGFATRMWPITRDLPKSLLPLGHAKIIDHQLDKLVGIEELSEVVISTNKKHEEQFRRWLAREKYEKVRLVIEPTLREEEKLGAVGALHEILGSLEFEHLLIMAGDNVFSFRIEDLIESYREKGSPIVAVHDVRNPELARELATVWLGQGDRIVGFEEKPVRPRSTLVATACYILPSATAARISDYLKSGREKDVLGRFIEWLHTREPVYGFRSDGYWFDVGIFDSYLDANKAVTKSTLISQEAEIDPTVEVLSPVVVNEGAVIRGKSVIGPYVWIGGCVSISDSKIEESIIFDGSRVMRSEISRSVLGPNCSLEGLRLSSSSAGAYSKIVCKD